jgi:hypothetical protein
MQAAVLDDDGGPRKRHARAPFVDLFVRAAPFASGTLRRGNKSALINEINKAINLGYSSPQTTISEIAHVE